MTSSAVRCQIALLFALAVTCDGSSTIAAHRDSLSSVVKSVTYDATILADKPVAYWAMSQAGSTSERDLSGSGLGGTYFGRPSVTKLPNGDKAADFNAPQQYLQVSDARVLSPSTTGVLTIEAWLRPDTLDFKYPEGPTASRNYVNWLGKGTPANQEYAARIYSMHNTGSRPNRLSGYLFNMPGGLGAGSYCQDATVAGEWIYYVFVINSKSRSHQFPHGYTKLYKDGTLRAQNDLSIRDQIIRTNHSSAPLRVGTRDLKSFFTGAIGKVAIYGSELSAATVTRHFGAMMVASK